MSSIAKLRERCISLKGQIAKSKLTTSSLNDLCNLVDQRTTTDSMLTLFHTVLEVDCMKKARQRSYEFWPHISPTAEDMIKAGWFYCKIHDRVLCLYCDTICHQWRSSDNPAEVHQRFAPNCPFLTVMTARLKQDSTQKSISKTPCRLSHSSMRSPINRQATFEKLGWKQESPTIESFVRAGFFYAGVQSTVTCFYCSGTLQKWAPTDQPMIEHARWFPHCPYARHLCGDDLHARIQLKSQQHKKEKSIESDNLNRLVNARLDLPFVQKLREKYSIGIIRRCIEDQLKLGQDDFANMSDLYMSCYIIQKQLDVTEGKYEKILVPSLNENVSSTKNGMETTTNKFDDCVICLTEERQLACLPCGHLCACTPCAYSLDSCPICRVKVQSFVRIYSTMS